MMLWGIENKNHIFSCGGSVVVHQGPGFEPDIFHNDPCSQQDHCVILYI